MVEALHEPLPRFLLQALLILALSRLLGIGARRLGQPAVVAEILAGVLLGPSLLGLVAPALMHGVFPAASMPLLGIASQVGLVFFMFLIGLELDPALLRGHGRKAVLISHSSIVAPFALGALAAYPLYHRLSDPEVALPSFALFMGVAMSITAFPVLARILTERRLLRTKVGSMTLACAAVDDVTAWCVLAIVVAVVRASALTSAFATTLFAALYIVAMGYLVRPFLARLGQRFGHEQGLDHNAVAAVFGLLLVSALVTELIGIHALFGAFVLGAVMPRQAAFTERLVERIEDLVVVFLLPLFFAYSGLRTEIGLLETVEDWLLCGALILIACAGKFGGSSLAARLTGSSWREASAIGILMNTRGLMELIVLNIGLDLGIISPRLFTMMVIMALTTTFITTPLLRRVLPDVEMLKESLGAPVPEEPVPAARLGTLVCVADPRNGPDLVQFAAAIADGGEHRVWALQLSPVEQRTSPPLAPRGAAHHRKLLEPTLERGRALGLQIRRLSFPSIKPAADICRVAALKRADLILLGYHRPLVSGRLLGGVVAEVMQDAPVDVAVLFDRGLPATPRRVLVPYSGSGHDVASLRLARRLCSRASTEIVLLHVIDPRREGPRRHGPEEAAEQAFPEGNDRRNRVVFKLVVHPDAVETVLQEAHRGYDLLIIGADPTWGLSDGPFALRTERILRQVETSVVVVHQAPSPLDRTPAPPHDA